MIIVGGLGSIQGSIYGTIFVALVPEALRSLAQVAQRVAPDAMTFVHPMRDIVFGGMIVGFLVFEPHGLAELVNRSRRFFALWPFPK
jgi:branched-chain amino acid transport system permease protein